MNPHLIHLHLNCPSIVVSLTMERGYENNPMGKTVERVKNLWETWDIRVLMLTSLLIQALLTLVAPYRKRCANGLLKIFMWLLYLSADAVALFTIGLIAHNGDRNNNPNKGVLRNADILAFWSPFLLLHLGGPDTITALALEDNELWRRHALQLATQVVVSVYVFSQSVRKSTGLVGPMLLMFVDGCVKYFERTCALYYASMDNFRDTQRREPNYSRLMEEYNCAISASIPATIQGQDLSQETDREPYEVNNSPLNRSSEDLALDVDQHLQLGAPNGWYQIKRNIDVNMVHDAYQWYDKFQGLLADAFLSLKDRDESRQSFLKKEAGEAFRTVEIELNFMYDVFYTKVFLLQRRRGYARFLCSFSVMASLVLFAIKDKSDYLDIDVGITYALLGGAIALDIIASIMFLFSDWSIILSSGIGTQKQLYTRVVTWLRRCLGCRSWYGSFRSHSRWSQSISKYSLLQHCLKDLHSSEHGFMRWVKDGLKNVLISLLYVDTSPIDQRLGDFIFNELHKKAELATDLDSAIEVCSARGNLIFQDDFLCVSEYLRPWTVDVDYDESLLTWHLATDMCYWTSTNNDNDQINLRKISKQLSDYMSYLFLRQKALVSPVLGTTNVRVMETCTEAKNFIQSRYMLDGWFSDATWNVKKCILNMLCLKTLKEDDARRCQREEEILKQCCEKNLQVNTEVRCIIAKIDRSKSVFYAACNLSKQLNKFGDSQWKIMAKVWLEMLCYAAVRCTPRSHVAQLSNGGELITLVWWLMAHLGLGERFHKTQRFGLTKLIIPK